MSAITTHVLDTTQGCPAHDVPVRLEREGQVLAEATTDTDGRVRDLGPQEVPAGTYRLVFDTASYFESIGRQGFFPEVTITFTITDPAQHHHVPLLLSPYGYSTYRGS
ncbi:MAG TPA: hydroxyisourate hydrolase [Nocardioidaceae bacterium]|nr:hydroxyisourate hydrolase [Nocardioidaceae bacterium]